MLIALEMVAAVILVVGAFSQIIAPLWRGTKLFPAFRRQGTLEAQLDAVRQEQTEAELEAEVREAQEKLEKRRVKNKPSGSDTSSATSTEGVK